MFAEQIQLLQEQSRPAVLLNLPLILITVTIFWSNIPYPWLVAWAGTLGILSFLRLSLFKRFETIINSHECIKRWSRIHLLITAITGALWGSISLLLLTTLNSYQENYIILIILGLTGTSISVNASYFPNFLAFLFPAILPLEFVLITYDKALYNGFSYLLLLYLFVLIKAAHATERNVRHTISLRHENQSLVSNLRQTNAELIQEIELRTSIEGELRDAKEMAEFANRSKSEFISHISHELRTPLTVILGFSGILSHDRNLTDTLRTDIGKINKAGQHLLTLLDDLLDISRIEKGSLSITSEPISLDELLDETRSLITPLAEKARIHLEISTPPANLKLMADYMRLKQVLLNLLTNAIKYNRTGGQVLLTVETTTPERARINVIDTGHGIAADKLKQIFQPYNRLGAEKTEILGSGIGMTISKQIMDLMHGDIDVESELGKGSHFWIELPIASEQAGMGIEDTDFLMDGLYEVLPDGFRCLYVEDNPSNIALIRRMMEHMGHIELLSAPSAELGIALATVHQPDLILMDINLPGMDGYAALEILRNNDENKHIPIIAISGSVGAEEIKRGLAAGFDDYLTKPVNMESLAASIARNFRTKYTKR